MKGKICHEAKYARLYVAWYHKGKSYKIYKYNGIPIKDSMILARKLLSSMQGDEERGVFRIEKYLNQEYDVVPYLRQWIMSIQHTLAPATQRDYNGYIENHLVPFFENRQMMLHEIEYDTIMELLGSLKGSGKTKSNIIFCLHACLKYAWKSKRIPSVPPFPEKKDYQIVKPVVKWLPSDRQEAVINAIPIEHQPIFWFLKYHLRRPGDAMALLKEDYADGVFTIHRGISAKKEIDRTKTGDIHIVPAVSSFLPYTEIELQKQKDCGIISPYFFCNPRSQAEGHRYTHNQLEDMWRKACVMCGEDIDLYRGTKTSTACIMRNEWGYGKDQIQTAGQWRNAQSVEPYLSTSVEHVKSVLEGKVISLHKKSLERIGANGENKDD